MNVLKKDQILTHRGLEPAKQPFFAESSFDAFKNHLSRGFSIEFDPAFTKDGIIIFHDSTFSRFTNGKDTRSIKSISTKDALSIPLLNGHLTTLENLLNLIQDFQPQFNALHLKSPYQQESYLSRLIDTLAQFPRALPKLLLIDLKPETANFIKEKLPNLSLATSIAHPYDIQRFNQAVGNTLLSVDEAITHKDLYSWAWLDEWDLSDANNNTKKLYTQDTFQKLRNHGFKISLVTPEIHGTSPGLLGGEAHPDAAPLPRLKKRIQEILALEPNAICTDYPEIVLELQFGIRKSWSLEETNRLWLHSCMLLIRASPA